MNLKDVDLLKQVPLFNGKYDKKNANMHFINGIETVMEYINALPTACEGCDKLKLKELEDDSS